MDPVQSAETDRFSAMSTCFIVLARSGKAQTGTCWPTQVDGKVTYNGHGFGQFVVPRTAAYVDQNSNHIAELTVRETLDFAQRVQGVDYSALS